MWACDATRVSVGRVLFQAKNGSYALGPSHLTVCISDIPELAKHVSSSASISALNSACDPFIVVSSFRIVTPGSPGSGCRSIAVSAVKLLLSQSCLFYFLISSSAKARFQAFFMVITVRPYSFASAKDFFSTVFLDRTQSNDQTTWARR